MELKDKKLKIKFEELGEGKEKREFDPKKIIEERNEAMPVPEMMKKDYKKIEAMMNKKELKK